MDPGRQVSRFLFFCLTCFPGATLFGQSPTLIFPQLADGGGYVFEILLTNPTLGEESGVVYFWDTSGSPMEIQLAGTGTTSVAYAIPSGGSKKITSDGAGDLKVGYATVVSDQEITGIVGSIIYLAGGNEVSVPNSAPSRENHVFIEYGGGVNSGFAVANPSDTDVSATAILLDQWGLSHGGAEIDLTAGWQKARFVNEIVPSVEEGFVGSLQVYADSPISLMGIRLKSTGELAVLPGSPTVVPDLTDLKIVVGTRSIGVHTFGLDGVTEKVIEDLKRYIDVFENKLFVKQILSGKPGIGIYDFDFQKTGEITIPEGVEWWEFAVVGEDEVALIDHDSDTATFISFTGDIRAEVTMADPADDNLQCIRPVLVEDKLVVLDGGDDRMLSIDLETYEVEVIRSTWAVGPACALTYANGRFYHGASSNIYSFTADEEETLLATIPGAFIADIVVLGRMAFFPADNGNAVYQVDLESGAYSKLVPDLKSPISIVLLPE